MHEALGWGVIDTLSHIVGCSLMRSKSGRADSTGRSDHTIVSQILGLNWWRCPAQRIWMGNPKQIAEVAVNVAAFPRDFH